MPSIIDILHSDQPIIDVRTPAEFEQAHIPGAHNIPLFTNQERHEVGLTYKQVGKDAAVKLGLTFVGPKLASFVEAVEAICPSKQATIHCWRGGMRSQSMSWLLNTSGFQTKTIEGGYKAFRNIVLEQFKLPIELISLGGNTGGGKTDILKALNALGEPVIDLEGIANHKGSAFGNQGPQPSTEHFENTIAFQLIKLKKRSPIWVEDESRNIGKVFLPAELKLQMNASPLIIIERSFEQRVEALCEDYGKVSTAELIADFKKIEKRIGGQFVKAAIEHLEQGDIKSACAIALKYYDKSYNHSMVRSGRKPSFTQVYDQQKTMEIAQQLIEWKNQNLLNTVTDQAAVAK
jgi:tRNA 2-selenouridine synthase